MRAGRRTRKLVGMISLAAADTERALRTIVCGVDGTAAGREAARQAAALAGDEGRLEFVAGAPRACSTPLADAGRVAQALGVAATARTLAAATAADGLIRAAAHADVLVI